MNIRLNRMVLFTRLFFSVFQAKDLYKQTGGRQQVLPLDSIYKKNLTEWKKLVIYHKIPRHFDVRFKPSWKPAGTPVKELPIFNKDENNYQIAYVYTNYCINTRVTLSGTSEC